jgi:hypothetical protein
MAEGRRKKEEGIRVLNQTRSPLAPLKKGGTRVFVKSPKTSGGKSVRKVSQNIGENKRIYSKSPFLRGI